MSTYQNSNNFKSDIYYNKLTTVQSNQEEHSKGGCVKVFSDCSDPKLEPGA
jgi:hypothetical protein